MGAETGGSGQRLVGTVRLGAKVVVASIAFGMLDERLTRLGGSLSWLAQLTNSREFWAAWPVVIGLAVGGWWRAPIAGIAGVLMAIVGFYAVHIGGGWVNAVGVAKGGFSLWVLAGVLGGLAGAGVRLTIVWLFSHLVTEKPHDQA